MIRYSLLFLSLLVLPGCSLWRSDTKSDKTAQRDTVVKETVVVAGTSEWNNTKTTYREETTKDVAHAEQTKEHSSPAAEGLLAGLSGGVTGNPLIDLILAYVTGKVGLGAAQMAGGAAVAHIRRRKPKTEKKDDSNAG